MPENITVNKAIWSARIRLTILPIIVFLCVIGVLIYLASIGLEKWIMCVVAIIYIPVTIYYRDKMSFKWYIWALSNVRNVHELRQRAIFERLISNKESQFLKPTDKHHEIITILTKKFDVPDEYTDDPNVPAVTKIYLAKTQKIFMLIIMLICFAAGLMLITMAHLYIAGCVLCAASGYMAYDCYKSISNSDPQIIINNEGITTTTSGFHNWRAIKNEFVGIEGVTDHTRLTDDSTGKRNSTYYYLSYDLEDGREEFPLYDLHINHWKMAKLLKVYRGRSI